MTHYSFTTDWSFDAPVDRVWEAITRPLEWPDWWPGVETVIEIKPGDGDGLGGVHRSSWRSALPYRLTFDSRIVRVERLAIYEIEADGELQGHGLWTFAAAGTSTRVRYDWDVVATKWWMRFLAPVARPLFRWNHDVIMRWGQQGLAARLARIRG
jgi:uncharacterized protein YndB with AHSA1/START domain